MNIFGVINETSTLAKRNSLATGYLDAKQDIEAAVEYAYNLNQQRPLIILGSSYSASLALLIASHSDKTAAVIAFSPGESLKGIAVAEEIKSLTLPMFVTGAKKEISNIENVLRFVSSKNITLFKPKTDGFHGSKTLWESVKGYETYWSSLAEFLSNIQN